MVVERDYTLQQGDTKRIVIPVLDSDDPNADFFAGVGNVSVTFSIAESFTAQTAAFVAASSNVNITPFSNVKLASDEFNFADVDVADGFSIPGDQDVIVVTLPKSETAALTPGEKVYQCRIEDTATPSNRLTPVKGTVTVEPSTPTTE
jgi:hypothetical protein